jgi:hypothetical protein
VMDQRTYYSFDAQPISYEFFTNPVFTYSPHFAARIVADDIFHPPLA